jgi:peptidyl-prolyl cis-trans isomerase C
LRTSAAVTVAIPFAAVAFLLSCGRPTPPASTAGARVVATVNGVPLTEADLDQRTRRTPAPGAPGHDVSANVLQTLVREELVAQRAVALGLDREPGYRAQLDQMEAQVRAFKRQQLAVLYRTWAQGQAAPTDADARAWFDRNADFVRTRFHVLQIMRRGELAELQREREALSAGTPFEKVAARRFPDLPASVKQPWDLGEMAWNQIPPAWRGVVDRLEPGQVSDVVAGDAGRAWILKLQAKRVDPAITFETEKDRIVDALRQQRAAELYDAALADLKAKATIVYAKDPPSPRPE